MIPALRTAGLALLLAATAASALAADPNITGQWARYPRPASQTPPDPRFAPPRAGEPELKEPFATQYRDLRQRQRESDAKGEPLANAGTECIPGGVPSMMGAIYPIEILQTGRQITVIAEAGSEVRRIYLNEKSPPLDDIPPGYYGASYGAWKGNELTVETLGVREDVKYRDIPHSAKMKVVERFKLVAPDILHDTVTFEDPDTLAKPYTVTFAYQRMPNYKLLEYVCENNRSYVDDKGVTRMRLDEVKK
jgi:hypothetical protein